MSPGWNEFEAMADLARREPIPAIDVADRVVASLLPQTPMWCWLPIHWKAVTSIWWKRW